MGNNSITISGYAHCAFCKVEFPLSKLNKRQICINCSRRRYIEWSDAIHNKTGEKYRIWLIRCLQGLEKQRIYYQSEIDRLDNEKLIESEGYL